MNCKQEMDISSEMTLSHPRLRILFLTAAQGDPREGFFRKLASRRSSSAFCAAEIFLVTTKNTILENKCHNTKQSY